MLLYDKEKEELDKLIQKTSFLRTFIPNYETIECENINSYEEFLCI